MTKKVVSLNPDAIAPGDVNAEVVELLEKYLAQAKRGEILGISVAMNRANGHIATEWCGASGSRFPLGYAIGLLSTRYYLSQMEDIRE